MFKTEKYYVLKHCPKVKSILEIGFGDGNLSYNLAKKYPAVHITAIDGDKEYYALANKINSHKRIIYVCSNFENFKSKNVFDVIIASEVIEHLSNIDAFMKFISKHSHKGTILILTSDNAHYLGFLLESFKSMFIKKFNLYIWRNQAGKYYSWNKHYYNWTINTLGTILHMYNFTPFQYYYSQHGFVKGILNFLLDFVSFFVPFFRRKIVIFGIQKK
ncbi:hypothetical protein COV13_00170 [Candidatus Woesearchaeota archaeon CG10_big_fil_rev_8_21_14_0_10_32_9]|nr:MAG: hypothetical protein COV13_00170 [Candidatus Woesearchaeota archaeon CG10_big_fil_rev_8_21_14_0_10_32_9]